MPQPESELFRRLCICFFSDKTFKMGDVRIQFGTTLNGMNTGLDIAMAETQSATLQRRSARRCRVRSSAFTFNSPIAILMSILGKEKRNDTAAPYSLQMAEPARRLPPNAFR